MKKIIVSVTTILLSVFLLNVEAEVISQELAKQTADNFLSLDEEWQGEGDATLRLVEEDGVPAYYIVEYNRGGWAVVSAQSTSIPVICYNPVGKYESPEPMQNLLKVNAKQIVKDARLAQGVEHEGWRRVMQRKPAADPNSTPDISPLIKIDLDQSAPYNVKCPVIDGEHALVGCVAVGMAQAMMVQRYPERPNGKYSYKPEGMAALTIDYDQEPDYDWDAMYASEQTGNYDEIARLVYHCGVSVNMQYGLEGSGTQTERVADALPRNFGYNSELVRYVDRPESDVEWLDILLDDLLLGRVVVYRGQGEESGHCWNIDGWKQSTQMVHVNWGWGGYGNNYFNINAMEDKYQGMSFPYMNGAVLGVGVPTTAPYGLKLSRTKFSIGTEAGVALADVIVSCEDTEADFAFEILGPKNLTGKHTASPYDVKDGKLISTKTIADSNAFKYMKMKVTNVNTDESFEKEFYIQITEGGAVEAVLSDAMRVYPSVANDVLTIEVPAVGGEYAIYSVSGAQVSKGELAQYKTDVNVSNLAAGTYILRYVHNSGVGVKTFVKK